jgi:hypothetical protein
MGKNVLIPLGLLGQIVELLSYWDVSQYDRVIRDDYNDVLRELNVKMKKLELRDAYTSIIRAKDEDARLSARIEYLWQRSQIANEYIRDYDL